MFTFFERLLKPFPDESPGQPPSGLWAFFRHYTRGVLGFLIIMSLLRGLLALIEVFLFGFLGALVDWLSKQDPNTFFETHTPTLIGISFVILIALPVTVMLHSLLIHQTLLPNYPMRIRWQGHRYLLGQSLTFYQDEFAGRVSTKLFQTSLAVRETVIKVMDVLVYVAVYFFGMMALVGSSDWRLAWPLAIWLICYIGIMRYFLPKLRAVSMAQADARSTMTGRINDSYTNASTIKLFSHTHRESTYAKESMQGFLDTVFPQMRLATQLQCCVWTINAVLIFSVSALSIYLWQSASVSTGDIAIALGLTLRLNGMSQWIMWEISALFEHIGTVQDGIKTLSKPQGVVDVPKAPALQVSHGGIDFDSVSFNYGKDHGLIENLSLSIAPGEKVGVVGRSGAGKSTLVNLLLRFYDVSSGTISIDGQPIDDMTQDSLRASIGMVTQDTSLLHRSVRDNILYGRPDATDEELNQAIDLAHAREFIRELSDHKGRRGLEAHVGERGVKLSGGQRQRIAIARVLLKNAPILVLDEATSALDSGVEAAIQESLYQLMKGKTVIAIAHRLSTIAAMDRLIVLDKGRIIEQGTHKELLEAQGIYASLWSHQSGGFIAPD